MYLKRQSKPYQTWNQNIIPTQINNSPIFHKTLKNNSNSIVMNTHGMNHQQQHLITTTTSINHEFINNPTTTISYFTNFGQNTKYTCIYSLSMKFHHQQLNYHQIQIHNTTSKYEHEFHQLNSQQSLLTTKHLYV